MFQEDDPFDEAFDLLAKDSINKFALQDIEKDLNDDDLFDTTKADTVLNLASIANLEKVILNSSYPSKKKYVKCERDNLKIMIKQLNPLNFFL